MSLFDRLIDKFIDIVQKLFHIIFTDKKNMAEFKAQFAPEIFEIAAVIAPDGFGCGMAPDFQGYWSVTARITAWQNCSNGEVTKVKKDKSIMAEVYNTKKLKKQLKENSIITAKVRMNDWGFLLVKIIETDKTYPELETILKKQLQPVQYKDEVLGTFELDKGYGFFMKECEWLGKRVMLSFEKTTKAKMQATLSVVHVLYENQSEWDARMRKFAVGELLKDKTWLGYNLGYDEDDLTEAQTMEMIKLDEITVYKNGYFAFGFGYGEESWNHGISVEGDLESGPVEATNEG